MTIMIKAPGQVVTRPPGDAPADRGKWRAFALAAICAAAAVLYAWRIGSEGWGNPYYSAAVKSMSASVTNFVFGSFDPLGVVTVDKPPMAFWPMVASAAIFGYHGWSLLLPQVVEGVAAVWLLHRTVRHWAGEHVALLAALVLALTPVTVAINRDTNPDTLMVLLLVAAAYAFTRSVQQPLAVGKATRWLMLAALFLGLGFVTKMLQAWIVVPAFALAYLAGSVAPVRRRILDLLGAGAVLLASSLWWMALISFWPGPKPYIGGSTNGSVLSLVIGYNGLGRIFGRENGRALVNGPVHPGGAGGPGAVPWAGRGGGRGFGGSGITRLFGEQVGGQISWLLPLCLLVLVVVAISGMRRVRSGIPANRTCRAGWVLWGGWLLLVGLVLSFAQGISHPYYTTEIAPAVAAVTAAGMALMWRHYRRPAGHGWLLLPAAVTLTTVWAWALVSRDLSWNGWLRYAVAAAGVAAVVLLIAGRAGNQTSAGRAGNQTSAGRAGKGSVAATSSGLTRAAMALSVVAILLAPAVWSTATAFAASSGALAQAGPHGSAFGHGRPGQARGELPARFRGAMAGDLTADQAKILAYAQANSAGAPITLAVEGGAMATESYLIHSNAMIIGMGGFSGQDLAPTVSTLAQWVQQGNLRFVLAGGRDMGGTTGLNGLPGLNGWDPGGAGRERGVSAERTQWVQQHCTTVNPAAYGGSASTQPGGPLGPANRSEVLYDCQPS
jgi:4-amino-4-deoxy-L-arabinose transferase-like glycosyltransferase